MTHTPAPWHEEIDEDGDLWVIQDSDHSVFIGNLEDTCGECHANAALMAAAPDLLAVAEMITARADEHAALDIAMKYPDGVTLHIGISGAELEQIRVAIAKATGNTAAPGGE